MAEVNEPREVVSPEDIERDVDDLLALVDAQAERIRKAQDELVVKTRRPSRVRTRTPGKPNVSELLRADLRSALADELVIAPYAHGEAEIEPAEFDREIMKRALIRLKVSDLREEAENLGVDWRGTEEEVANRLALALKFDERKIAELVLRYADIERPITGFNERIYALTHRMTDLDAIQASVTRVVKRYVRVGVARWFVFRSVDRSPSTLRVSGLFRSFRAEPTEVDNEFWIQPIEVAARATVRFDSGSGLVRIRSKGVSEGQGALLAIQRVTGIQRSPVVPLTFDLPLDLMGWDRRTLYLLDFVAHALHERPLFVQNLTAAHFETDDSETVSDEIRPRLKSIKFEGDWVGDSPQACQLLVAKRTLVGVSLIARYKPNPDETFYFPVRVNVAKDHLDVLTGFGNEREEDARIVHKIIMERAERGLTELSSSEKTVELMRRIVERADAHGPVNVDLLSQPTDSGDPAHPSDEHER